MVERRGERMTRDLVEAVQRGQVRRIRALVAGLGEGDVNLGDALGMTPLHVASQHDHSEVV